MQKGFFVKHKIIYKINDQDNPAAVVIVFEFYQLCGKIIRKPLNYCFLDEKNIFEKICKIVRTILF